jgi:hypothetical protein
VYPAFAEGFKIDGEAKTGLLSTKTETQINDPTEEARTGSKDDAGNGPGRLRLNMEYTRANFGIKLRLNWEDWSFADVPVSVLPYAFGYGNFFDDQFTVSFGKLGASPWGTGGPDMWKELEMVNNGGIRFEYKPSFIPELKGLNVGFVLNGFNGYKDTWGAKPVTFFHVLQESVIGVSYTHEFFHVRAAYRFDSEVDVAERGPMTGGDGGELVYRLEERILRNYISGFEIGALGYWHNIGADENNEGSFGSENWLFVRYAPDLFTAQIRFGYDSLFKRQILHIKPSFYLNLFNKLIKVGASFLYGQDFGEFKVYPGSPFTYMEIEPLIQVNFAANAYIAFAYNLRREYKGMSQEYIDAGIEPVVQTQWINLRFGLTF